MIGKWVLINDEESYNVGQVVEVVNEFFVMIRIRPHNGPPRIGLFEFPSLLHDTSFSVFFDTEEEMDNFIKWLDTPEGESKLKVVPIKKEVEK